MSSKYESIAALQRHTLSRATALEEGVYSVDGDSSDSEGNPFENATSKRQEAGRSSRSRPLTLLLCSTAVVGIAVWIICSSVMTGKRQPVEQEYTRQVPVGDYLLSDGQAATKISSVATAALTDHARVGVDVPDIGIRRFPNARGVRAEDG